jgi:predicted membrane-bound mannosyltransferase
VASTSLGLAVTVKKNSVLELVVKAGASAVIISHHTKVNSRNQKSSLVAEIANARSSNSFLEDQKNSDNGGCREEKDST